MTTIDRAGNIPAGALTDNQLSDLELAQDLIDTMYSIVSSRIWKRRAMREPETPSTEELKKALEQCNRDRRLLSWHKQDRIAMQAIIDQYRGAIRHQLSMH
ncbi:hypothetical protein [Burkholderia pseudomallei]|uniref:hypothetical protein n=1 Tax=Burkholderia pseudomallei TaxID=28450 RepID=UPI000A8A5EA3|nr:hypothetical protein [Burkholderia pseudomallei]